MKGVHELLQAPVFLLVRRGTVLKVEFCNDQARRAVGGRALTGKVLSDVFPELERWLQKVVIGPDIQQPYVGVDEQVTLDWSGKGQPETRYLTVASQPLHDGSPLEGTVVIVIDVTESVLARLQAPRDRLWVEQALDAIATPVIIVDAGTRRLLFANEAARELSREESSSGRALGQAVGGDPGYFFSDTSDVRIPDDQLPVARAARGEVVDAMDLLWHTPAGVTPLVCFAETVPATDTLPSVIVLSFFDVSRAQRAEDEIRDVASAKDDFLTLVSHELCTPLTALKLQVQTLQRQLPSAVAFDAIARATARMEALVEQMLDAGRIRMEGVRLHPALVDLCTIVDRVIERFRSEASRVGCSVSRVGVAHLPGNWDDARLEHVLANLLCNALRFGPRAPVTLNCRDLGARVSVAVSDQGIGIDPADHDRIFDRYARAVPTSNFGGLGLGLWVSREIVKKMGGSITVMSEPGAGATFIIELPKDSPSITE